MNPILSISQYMGVANAILLNRYDENNLLELINGILFLLKIDESKIEILIRYIRSKVNRNIRRSIENINNIYDILQKLIHLMINNTRNIRVTLNNNRINNNRNNRRRNNESSN